MAKSNSTTTIPTEGKHIQYDRETKDYACYLDGEYIGHRANYSDAETTLNGLIYDKQAHGDYATATQLDGGSSDEEIAADYATDARDGEPVGSIHGCAVYAARYDEPGEESHGQLYRWSLDWNGKTITVYDDCDILSIYPTGNTTCKGDIHLGDWQWLRSLAQTDIVERLTALARGKDEPPATPAVRVEPHICDDAVDTRRYGTHIWTDYSVGEGDALVEIAVATDGRWPPQLYIGGQDMDEAAAFEQTARNAVALFDDPQVRAVLTAGRVSQIKQAA